MTHPVDTTHLTRREVVLGGLAIAGLTACSGATESSTATPPEASTSAVPGEGSTQPGSSTEAQSQPGAGVSAPAATQAPGTAEPSPVAGASGAPGPTSQPGPTVTALPPAPAPGAPALFVDHGLRDGTAVSLTYHASGSPSTTAALLDVLKANNVKVTVFAVGQWLAANPVLGRRIVDEGHELANHTLTHKSMGSLSAAVVASEISGGGQALVPFIGSIGTWFRPSGIVVPTATILDEAGTAGYSYSIGYDVDTLDFEDPGADAVLANFQRGVQPGSIVSMHFGHRNTVDATPRILAHLDSIGLRHVTLGELFAGS